MYRWLLFIFVVCVATSTLYAEEPYPRAALERDWMQQDAGRCDVSEYFISSENHTLESVLISNVLRELGEMPELVEEQRVLEGGNVPGADARWKALYLRACEARRAERLKSLVQKTNHIVYFKHCPIAAPGNISSNHHPSDYIPASGHLDPAKPRYNTWVPGAKMCRLTCSPEGEISSEVLLETKDGFLRDPALSFDGKILAFARRESFTTDNYQIWLFDFDSRTLRQLTHLLEKDGQVFTNSNLYPCFLPDGRILFQSTRCAQLDPCGWDQTGTFYTCDARGANIRRITYDQVTTMSPVVLDDGRILYTRWEYNDRTPVYVQPLFTMNPDGTNQTEFYGNNSWFPTSLLHGRGVPGSHKIMAIASGHHVLQKGKLVLVDRTRGTQEESGIEYLAGSAPDGTPGRSLPKSEDMPKIKGGHLDGFGQAGPQFAHPFPFSESEFLVSFTPDGYQGFGVYGGDVVHPSVLGQPFGLYWMTADGKRELLAFDPASSCLEALPILPRPVPAVRGSQVDFTQNVGTYYIQNVHLGPGLEGISAGTARRLRVVGLEYRAAFAGSLWSIGPGGDASAQTPIGVPGCAWDVKHVLGEVPIEPDGSVFFEVPARVPVYFQILDEEGRMIQSMRSWSMLMPGERMACLGCHEDKVQVGTARQDRPTLAMGKPVQKLQPAFGRVHPLLATPESYGSCDSVAGYLNIQRPRSLDPDARVDGFSFRQEIQPVLDRHCVRCHDSKSEAKERSALDLTSAPVPNPGAKRLFTRSYLALTNGGQPTPLVNWIVQESVPPMLPPRSVGSSQSGLMKYFMPEHYGVSTTDAERCAVACWIDLGVPFCGSYPEANLWSPEEKARYDHYQQKRVLYSEEEWKLLCEKKLEKVHVK